MFRHLLILLLAIIFILPHCKKVDIRYDLKRPGIIAQVDEQVINTSVFDKLWSVIVANRLFKSFGRTPGEALLRIIENMLISNHFAQSHSHLKEDAELKHRIRKVYLQTADFYLQNENLKKDYDSLKGYYKLPGPDQLAGLFDKTGKPKIKKKQAEALVLEVAAAEKKLEPAGFLSFYQTLNKNERSALIGSQVDQAYLRELLDRFARERFLEAKIAADTGSKSSFQQIKQVVSSGIYASAYMNELGISQRHGHADETDAMKERVAGIAMSRVESYYEKHKEDYKEVKTANCYHILVGTAAKAQALQKELADKPLTDFISAVKKHSLHADKDNTDPGRVLDVKNDSELHLKPRLNTLCLMGRQGKTEVFPNEKQFEVVRVAERKMGYAPLDETSTIIKDIKKKLALSDLSEEFNETRKSVFLGVPIRINREELIKIGRPAK